MHKKTKATINHQVIRQWAEKLGGKPQIIDNPQAGGDIIGIRIDLPGKLDNGFFSESNHPKETSWEEFFDIFDKQNLALIYNENYQEVDFGSSYKFINRDVLKDKNFNPEEEI